MKLNTLLGLTTPVTTEDEQSVREWSENKRVLLLLAEQRSSDWILLYGTSYNVGSFFLRSILVPLEELAQVPQEDLSRWENGSIVDSCSCGLVYGGGAPPRVEFYEPKPRFGSRELNGAQQLVFGRSFDGRKQDTHYFEIARSITHAHGLHWTPERQAWCRFDENGEVEEVIKVETREEHQWHRAAAVTIRREVLEMHISARAMGFVQMFDSTCVQNGLAFHGWKRQDQTVVHDAALGLHYRMHAEGKVGGYVRGIQIIRPRRTAEEYGVYLEELANQPKEYESFITHDWKNGKLVIMSCAPSAMASYFDKDSQLPFETSPVFFKPAVLDKYRADPEKYRMDHRSITCRSSWSLQTYDVNQAGQVHTYIKYLGDLPFNEQKYWRAFNEDPRGGISKRAYTTDFEGSFDQEPDSLRDLQGLLSSLGADAGTNWFTVRQPELIEQLHYPLTESTKGWADAISTLAKLVNEGLERKYFESKARVLGAQGDAKWGSILWARDWMRVTGTSEDIIVEVIEPLRDLQHLRSNLGGPHSSGAEANAIRADLLAKFGSPREHIFHLAAQLVNSLATLRELTRPASGDSNLP